MPVWTSARFSSAAELIQFLNVRRLAAPDFHVVVARDDEGGQHFLILYQEQLEIDAVGQAVQEAELLPVVESAAAEVAAAAVEAAEEIIHRHEDGEDT
jgi:hypothetical protein